MVEGLSCGQPTTCCGRLFITASWTRWTTSYVKKMANPEAMKGGCIGAGLMLKRFWERYDTLHNENQNVPEMANSLWNDYEPKQTRHSITYRLPISPCGLSTFSGCAFNCIEAKSSVGAGESGLTSLLGRGGLGLETMIWNRDDEGRLYCLAQSFHLPTHLQQSSTSSRRLWHCSLSDSNWDTWRCRPGRFMRKRLRR